MARVPRSVALGHCARLRDTLPRRTRAATSCQRNLGVRLASRLRSAQCGLRIAHHTIEPAMCDAKTAPLDQRTVLVSECACAFSRGCDATPLLVPEPGLP